MATLNKKYTNEDITVYWQPGICIHSTICWQKATGLPAVFNPAIKPWIDMNGAATEAIIAQVKKCPSGALSFFYNQETGDNPEIINETKVEVMPNGPLMVYGNLTVKKPDGTAINKNNVTAFCRCGQSANKPFCDGSHTRHPFEA